MTNAGTILLVDHSRGALLFQETILRRRHHAIFTALSGGEGLEKALAPEVSGNHRTLPGRCFLLFR